jgi:hypothetical protein
VLLLILQAGEERIPYEEEYKRPEKEIIDAEIIELVNTVSRRCLGLVWEREGFQSDLAVEKLPMLATNLVLLSPPCNLIARFN